MAHRGLLGSGGGLLGYAPIPRVRRPNKGFLDAYGGDLNQIGKALLEIILRPMESAGKQIAGDAPVDPDRITDATLATMGLGYGVTGLVGGVPRGALGAFGAGKGKSVRAKADKNIRGENIDRGYADTKVSRQYADELDRTAKVTESADHVASRGVDISDLQGGYLTNLTGDRTNVGTLTEVLGHTLDTPVGLQGGKGYMRGVDTGVWASDPGVIKQISKTLDRADGADVYGAYTPMAGGSSDFAHMTGAVAEQFFDPSVIGKPALKRFDKRVRAVKGGEDFPGIMSESFDDWMSASGKNRTTFYQQLGTDASYKDGFPDMAAVRHAIQSPRLRDIAPGDNNPLSGQAIGKLDASGAKTPAPHGTYPIDLAGDYVGGLLGGVPRSLLFPDFSVARRAAGKPTALDNRAFQVQSVMQQVDQRLVDSVSKHLLAQKLKGR